MTSNRAGVSSAALDLDANPAAFTIGRSTPDRSRAGGEVNGSLLKAQSSRSMRRSSMSKPDALTAAVGRSLLGRPKNAGYKAGRRSTTGNLDPQAVRDIFHQVTTSADGSANSLLSTDSSKFTACSAKTPIRRKSTETTLKSCLSSSTRSGLSHNTTNSAPTPSISRGAGNHKGLKNEEFKMVRRVAFAQQRVREYEVTLDENLSFSSNPPVSLGWRYNPNEKVSNLDDSFPIEGSDSQSKSVSPSLRKSSSSRNLDVDRAHSDHIRGIQRSQRSGKEPDRRPELNSNVPSMQRCSTSSRQTDIDRAHSDHIRRIQRSQSELCISGKESSRRPEMSSNVPSTQSCSSSSRQPDVDRAHSDHIRRMQRSQSELCMSGKESTRRTAMNSNSSANDLYFVMRSNALAKKKSKQKEKTAKQATVEEKVEEKSHQQQPQPQPQPQPQLPPTEEKDKEEEAAILTTPERTTGLLAQLVSGISYVFSYGGEASADSPY